MLVRDYMTRHPLMVESTMPIVDAQRYMTQSNVRRLPVVADGKRLLGLVTMAALRVDPARMASLNVWEITRYLSALCVGDVMIKREDVVTVGPDIPIEEAARVMAEHKVGCLPVLERDIVIGIITETDMLSHLMQILAAPEHGVRVTIRMPDVLGELAKLVAAISRHGYGILALGGTPAPKDPTHWDAVVKIQNASLADVVAALAVPGQEIIDVREV
jgi:acetoin utilization protein AcuB